MTRPPTGRSHPAAPRPAASRRRPAPRGRTLGRPGTRLRVGLALVLVVLTVLGGRLVQLQGLSGTAYAAVAQSERRKTTELPAVRGAILDRDGAPLAMSLDAAFVFGEPRTIRKAVCPPDAEEPCSAATIAAALAPLVGVPAAELEEKLSRQTAYVILARGLEPAVGKAVRAARLVGIGVTPESRRTHPGDALAANVVGFTNRAGSGAGGIEVAWDDTLAGVPGSAVAERDHKGREIATADQTRVEPVPGRDVQLTIDRDLQWQAEQVLAEKVSETEATSGSVVVLDVRTGEVLAMASAPTFDPDDPGASPVEHRNNPAVDAMYDPGSVNKVIIAAAAMEAGIVTPDSVLTVPHSQQFESKLVTDAHDHPTERYTLNGVIMQSSNVGTVQVAAQLGRQRIYDALGGFGFGEKPGLGLPGEQAGLVPTPDQWSGSSLGTIPIGQGVSVTAVQVASVYQTVANGGVRVSPSIVRATADPAGHLVPVAAPATRRVISPQTAAALGPMLEGVVSEEGTGEIAAIPGYRIAGKTGTADYYADGGYQAGRYTSSFVGYAPADAPRLVTAVVLSGTGRNGYYGGPVAGPVFKSVMGFALQAGAIPPSGRPFVPPKVFADGRK